MKNHKLILLILTLFLLSCGLIGSPTSLPANIPSTNESTTATSQVFIPTVANTITPFLSPTITLTPDPIQDIRAKFENPELSLYDEYDSIEVLLEGEILKLSIVRKEGESWGFESLQDMSAFLHLVLVDCTKYRYGHGVDGCKIKEIAPYEFLELREYLHSGELKAYVRFTVSNKKYFSGFDGTEIAESKIFELADESFLLP